MTKTHLYLRRTISIVALSLVALAVVQPAGATASGPELDPVTGAVAEVVETVNAEVAAVVESEPVPAASNPKKVVETVANEVAVPDTDAVASVSVEGGGSLDPASIVEDGAVGSTSSTTQASSPRRDRSRAGSSGSTARSGDDRKKLLAAGNDVRTTLMVGVRIEPKARPKPSGAPLALTGTSILMGLVVGLVLIALGMGTGAAGRQTGTAVA